MGKKEYQLGQLIDLSKMQHLLEAIHTLTGIPAAICGRDGTVLVAVGWQEICTKFHRQNPRSCALCKESDQYLSKHLHTSDGYVWYQCQNGLVDAAAPITVAKKHIATFYHGQIFVDHLPDKARFARQAEQYQFPLDEYMHALEKVPVLSREELDRLMRLGVQLAQVIGELSLQSMREKERNQRLQKVNRELHQTTTAMQNLQKHLIRSEKMADLGSIVAGVAHEINTPVGVSVTAISHLRQLTSNFSALSSSGSMRRSDFDRFLADLGESAAIVHSNLERAVRLIGNFKQFSTTQSQEIKKRFRIRQCLDSLLLSLQPRLKKTAHHLEVDCAEDLELFGRPDAFAQILTNLILNSLVHGYREDQSGHLRIQVVPKEHGLQLTYSDDGIGMTEEVRRRIFDPFFTTKGESDGSGLGLYILQKLIVDEFGGTVECRSKPGQGCTFVICLASDTGYMLV